MKKTTRRIIGCFLAVIMSMIMLYVPALADDNEASPDNQGETVTGSFSAVNGYDIATIRYYTDAAKTQYAFADFSYDENTQTYSYSFEKPYSGFTKEQGSEYRQTPEASLSSCTVIAYYYSLSVWDGAVDVSWYNETDADFYIYTPAQLAGVAAIVNGSIDGNTPVYKVKGTRSHLTDFSYNRGLPDYIESTYYESTNLIAGVQGPAYKGVMAHDFADRTIHIMSDMDMGGTDGTNVYMGAYDISSDDPTSNWNRNLHANEYPNWTPIGGEYLMDVSDSDTMIIAFFNGTIDGHGHNINNLYCYRWSYRTVGETAFGYSQGVGLVGMMGALYDDDRGTESNPSVMPTLRNMGLSGFVYGRRMVGGFVGCIGGGSNAADGTSVPGGIALENLANHSYAYCTDSKGLGGIAGCSMCVGSIINCYNTGNLNAQYAAPTGGIIGSNSNMDIFCCYNRGSITTLQQRGRGIGSNNSGSNYKVDSCYYLEGSGDDPIYPGYYTYNIAPSVSVNVTELTGTQMTNGTMLSGLNVNGVAYVQGDNGYPVLYWEAQSGTGSLTVQQPQGGTVSASATGSLSNGTVVYLSNTAATGWNFRNYLLNNNAMTGDYVTVNGSCMVSAYYESVQPGVLRIEQNSVCNIEVTKNGTVFDGQGVAHTVENYPVHSGDSIYEGDMLIVNASIKEGMVPDNPDLTYSYNAGLAVPFDYGYTYTGCAEQEVTSQTFYVGSQIRGEGVSLTLVVKPRTTQKLWRYVGDTTWYSDAGTTFVLTNAAELAGLAVLVSQGKTFSGKTIRLANDISLANNDGTAGRRFWDGIGTMANTFSGIFDGNGHSITDMHSSRGALFTYIYGTLSTRAEIRNLRIYGDASGADACGIAVYAKNTDISFCNSYVQINGSSGHIAGILGYGESNGSSTVPSVTLTDCFNYGNINGTGNVGGIVGELSARSTVTNCVNKGDIEVLSTNGNNVGGVAGSLNGSLYRCANYGRVLGYGRNIGGVAGQSVSALSQISDCYNIGKVSLEQGSSSYDSVGGIIGFGSFYKIYNSYNYGKVAGNGLLSRNIGGITGRDAQRSSNITSAAYMLDTSSPYVGNSLTINEISGMSFFSGVRQATTSDFSKTNSQGVMHAINGNGSFVLTNSTYPELSICASLHTHKGGTATCINKAVCTECGLEYGDVNPNNHIHTVIRNASPAVWVYDGNTGDTYCRDCDALIEKGNVIPADTSAHAVTVKIFNQNYVLEETKNYTRAEIDALKKTTPAIGYSYGTKSTEIMAATEYITLEDLVEDMDSTLQLSDLKEIKVKCSGTTDTISYETLTTCNKYYENDVAYDAPATFAISWSTLSGTLSQVAQDAKPSDSLRFGYGISEEQYLNNESVGGRRLVSPVTEIGLVLNMEGMTVSGSISGYTGTGNVSVALTLAGETEPAYSASAKGTYRIRDVEAGNYTLSVSADGEYVPHDYSITVNTGSVTQNVTLYQLGDVNMDGTRNALDVTTIKKHVEGKATITDPYILKLADIDGNGVINDSDATRFAKYLAKIVSTLRPDGH